MMPPNVTVTPRPPSAAGAPKWPQFREYGHQGGEIEFDAEFTGEVACSISGSRASHRRPLRKPFIHTGDCVSDCQRLFKVGKNALLLPLVLAGLSIPGLTEAQGFCSEPVAPYCVDKDSQFDTVLQINRCEEDLDNYEEQLKEYEQCIADQLESLREELDTAKSALEEARERF